MDENINGNGNRNGNDNNNINDYSNGVNNTNDTNAIFCTHCGKEVSEKAVVCVNCGIQLKKLVSMNTKFCTHCGEQVLENTAICTNCGAQLKDLKSERKNINSQGTNNVYIEYYGKNREKNKWLALFLCFFFGVWGVHKFYEGKIILGILYIMTMGFFGLGIFIDFFCILFKPNPYYV